MLLKESLLLNKVILFDQKYSKNSYFAILLPSKITVLFSICLFFNIDMVKNINI